MGQHYSEISDRLQQFIAVQKIFFVATAAQDGRVNVSPKGMDSLRIINPKRIAWLNVTGSGNETAAHVQQLPRMTLMFCAFEGDPMILRVYGRARVIHQNDDDWSSFLKIFPPLPGTRQIFVLDIDLVQTSCGMAVPIFDFRDERDQLNNWALKKGKEGIQQYWQDKNRTSLDGLPTNIIEKNI